MTIVRSRIVLSLLLVLAGLFVGYGNAHAATRSNVVIDPVAGAGQVSPGIGSYGVYNFRVTLPGPDDPAAGFASGLKQGHCIEPQQGAIVGTGTLRTGVEGADLALANGDPANLAILPGGRDRLEWLLLSSRAAVATAATPDQRSFEAAAHQRAVFLLVSPSTGGPQEPALEVPGLDAHARELLAASAAHGAAKPPTVSAVGPDVCGNSARTVRLAGAPFTTVRLAIAGGTGTIASPSGAATQAAVVLNAEGVADVAVTGGVGTLRINAVFEVPTLVQAEVPDSGRTGQDFAYLEFRPEERNLDVAFLTCGPPPPPAPGTPPAQAPSPLATPGVPATPPAITGTGAPSLRMTKTGPSVSPGRAPVVYTIVVRNAGTADLVNVVVTDPIPSGMSLVSIPKRARIAKRVVTWQVGRLAPGQRAVLRVAVRIDRSLSGRRCNTARGRADNAPIMTASACTRFVRVAGVSIPAVTG